jgi:hypothetical protein
MDSWLGAAAGAHSHRSPDGIDAAAANDDTLEVLAASSVAARERSAVHLRGDE